MLQLPSIPNSSINWIIIYLNLKHESCRSDELAISIWASSTERTGRSKVYCWTDLIVVIPDYVAPLRFNFHIWVVKRIHGSWFNDFCGGWFSFVECNCFSEQSEVMNKGLSTQLLHSGHLSKNMNICVTLLLRVELQFCYDIVLSRKCRTWQFNKEHNIDVIVWKNSTNLPGLKMLLPEEKKNDLDLYSKWLPMDVQHRKLQTRQSEIKHKIQLIHLNTLLKASMC